MVGQQPGGRPQYRRPGLAVFCLVKCEWMDMDTCENHGHDRNLFYLSVASRRLRRHHRRRRSSPHRKKPFHKPKRRKKKQERPPLLGRPSIRCTGDRRAGRPQMVGRRRGTPLPRTARICATTSNGNQRHCTIWMRIDEPTGPLAMTTSLCPARTISPASRERSASPCLSNCMCHLTPRSKNYLHLNHSA